MYVFGNKSRHCAKRREGHVEQVLAAAEFEIELNALVQREFLCI